MLSFNAPTWQTSLLSAAQQRSGRRGSSSILDRRRTASEVLPRLYLTDLFTARDETQLSSLGITHVVSVIEHAPAFPQTQSLRTLHIPLSDTSDQDILAHLPVTTSFIRDALAEGPDSRVLVHCLMGISRSATVVCAYLIATTKMTPDEALAAVKAKRGIVCPNLGFRRQLEEYARQVQRGKVRARPIRLGENVAEIIRKFTGGAQKGPNLSTTTASTAAVPLSLTSSQVGVDNA
ncbi:protein-tyrosine phosphatase-like protein [Lactifluus subvellereus]|nr:protein-tyrosine phosphatase-like protein [Lactifluus subvellereus]